MNEDELKRLFEAYGKSQPVEGQSEYVGAMYVRGRREPFYPNKKENSK